MNRIDKTLLYLNEHSKKMLSPYLTAGDPHPKLTVDLMHALVKAGADIVELGIPFSDPMAEGLVIQKAMERALAHKVTIKNVLGMVGQFRRQDDNTPVVIMGYLNPIEQYGFEEFAKDAKEAGVDGTIIVDLPPEESKDIAKIWKAHDLKGIYLCSPTTSDSRMLLVNQYAEGYLYYVSLKGVTGSNSLDLTVLKEQYQQRKINTDLPLMVGFGIKTPAMAAGVAEFADGVIVGAALITEIFEAYKSNNNVLLAADSIIGAMRRAIDANGNKQ